MAKKIVFTDWYAINLHEKKFENILFLSSKWHMTDILRNIIYMAKRFKLATLLNVVGLIIAFALFYLLMTQIIHQKNYNHGLENHERLYRLDCNYLYNKVWRYNDNVCQCFAEALRSIPQVESFALFDNLDDDNIAKYDYKKGNDTKKYVFSRCSPKAISTLCDHTLNGEIEWNENNTDDYRGLIIPASIALDYFGTIHATGDTMLLMGQDTMGKDTIYTQSIRGVYEDFPDNSEIRNCIYWRMEENDDYKYSLLAQYKCYVKLKKALDDSEREKLGIVLKQSILEYINENKEKFEKNENNLQEELKSLRTTNFRFTPIDDTYFLYDTHTAGESGYKIMLYILELACLLVILISTFNFLNFTLAESPTRVRGLNTRLVLGAERRFLRSCIVAECVIVSVVTCIVGIALCNLLPVLHISNLPLTGDLSFSIHWGLALLTVGLAVIVGVIAGIYPAIFATSFAPATALKGSFGLTPQGRKLRTALLCVQLFVSMLMFIYIGILYLQNHHIFNQPYGFDKAQLLYSNLPYIDISQAEDLEKELLHLPGIEHVSSAEMLLAGTDAQYEINTSHLGKQTNYYYTHVDHDYRRTMGIKVIEGRDFADDDSAAVIINEAARRQWPWLKLGDKISTDADNKEADSVTVIGVCENMRYGTMLANINQPFGFILNRNDDVGFTHLLVRMANDANQEATRQRANTLLHAFLDDNRPPYRYVLMPYDNCIAKSYKTELRFFNQMYLIAIFCLAITLIGLFCLTMFETEYRRKEIGIRKVTGATTSEIVWMLCKQYSGLILLCFVAAVPIAWYYGEQTLDKFADRASIHWWIFPLSLLFVGGIMLGTVALQSWLAARKNPASTIKTE